MPTVVDSLVVVLGLDPRGFNEGRAANARQLSQWKSEVKQTEEQIRQIRLNSTKATRAEDQKALVQLRDQLTQKKKSITEVEKFQKAEITRQKQLGEQVGVVKDNFLALAAVVAAGVGFAEFAKVMISGDAATGRMAENLGISTEKLSSWQGALREVGGTSADAVNSLQSLAQSFEDITLRGNQSKLGDLQGLGLQPFDIAPGSNLTEALLKTTDYRARMHMSDAEYFNRMSALGVTPNTIFLLEMGRKAVEAYIAAAAKAYPITKADADAARAAQANIANLEGAWTRLSNNLLNDALPTLTSIMNAMTNLAETDWSKTQWGPQIAELAKDTGALNTELLAMEDNLKGLAPAARSGFGLLIGLFDDIAREFQHLAAMFNAAAKGKWGEAAKEGWLALKESPVGDIITQATGGHRRVSVPPPQAAPAQAASKDSSGAPGSLDAAGAKAVVAVITSAPAAQAAAQAAGQAIATPPGQPQDGRIRRPAAIEAYLEKNGYTAAQARGIVAGIMAEGGSFTAHGPVIPKTGHQAYGLEQLLNPDRLATFAKLFGHAYQQSTPSEQLRFLLVELAGGDRGGAAVRAQTTAASTAEAYIGKFMRPGLGYIGDMIRVNDYLARSGAGDVPSAPNAPTNQTDIDIGTITINTAAKDAAAIARDIGPAIRRAIPVNQANTGLQ